MQTLQLEEIELVSGGNLIGTITTKIVGSGTGYAVGGFVAGVVEGAGYGSAAGPAGIIVGAIVGGAAAYYFGNSLA